LRVVGRNLVFVEKSINASLGNRQEAQLPKKTCVTLARKLAVILHKMLITGEPFRWAAKEGSVMA